MWVALKGTNGGLDLISGRCHGGMLNEGMKVESAGGVLDSALQFGLGLRERAKRREASRFLNRGILAKVAGRNSILIFRFIAMRRVERLERGGAECVASLAARRRIGKSAGQPVADCLCF